MVSGMVEVMVVKVAVLSLGLTYMASRGLNKKYELKILVNLYGAVYGMFFIIFI